MSRTSVLIANLNSNKMSKNIIAFGLGLAVMAAAVAGTVSAAAKSNGIFSSGKATVEKFEDKPNKATCYVLTNGNGISCVK
jgi:hypothetical protein